MQASGRCVPRQPSAPHRRGPPRSRLSGYIPRVARFQRPQRPRRGHRAQITFASSRSFLTSAGTASTPCAHDLARLARRTRLESRSPPPVRVRTRGGHFVNRLLLGRHDALQRRVARLVQSLLAGHQAGQRRFHHFHTAFHLALAASACRRRVPAWSPRETEGISSSSATITPTPALS